MVLVYFLRVDIFELSRKKIFIKCSYLLFSMSINRVKPKVGFSLVWWQKDANNYDLKGLLSGKNVWALFY